MSLPQKESLSVKLYSSLGPNPRLVRMFLVEKGIDVERIHLGHHHR